MISINQLLWTILPSDWLIYSLSIGDRPLVANESIFKFKTMAENPSFCKGFNSSFLQLDLINLTTE